MVSECVVGVLLPVRYCQCCLCHPWELTAMLCTATLFMTISVEEQKL